MPASLFPRGISKAGPPDEPRDQHGQWMRDLIGRGGKPYGTSGLTGLSREQAVGKVRNLLDSALSHQEGAPRAVTYTAALAAKVLSTVAGVPGEVAAQTENHVATATGYIVHKVLAHPAWRRIALSAVLRVKKSLEPDEAEQLKELVAKTIVDTRMHPRVSCHDEALSQVACGAYRHCHDRLSALKQAAQT